jgi:antitoxin (DNA-binding transcriptional repressor) of toxin-antitoxin stability system
MNKPRNNNALSFNRKAVGEITRGSGFSNLIKEVQSGSVTVLYKFNEPVAIILPCDRALEQAYTASVGAGAFVANAQENNTPNGLMNGFFRSLIETAAIAKLIVGMSSDSEIEAIEKEVLNVYRSALKKSSVQDKALSSHDTLSGAVPKVKQEGLPVDGNSSVSRKRGRPRKTGVSPL